MRFCTDWTVIVSFFIPNVFHHCCAAADVVVVVVGGGGVNVFVVVVVVNVVVVNVVVAKIENDFFFLLPNLRPRRVECYKTLFLFTILVNKLVRLFVSNTV